MAQGVGEGRVGVFAVFIVFKRGERWVSGLIVSVVLVGFEKSLQ